MKGAIQIDEKDYLPEQGNPENETVLFKIGNTYYEVSTSCDGTESLKDKLLRLLRSASEASEVKSDE